MTPNITCGACAWPMDPSTWNRSGGTICPRCRARVDVTVFPAMLRASTGALPQLIQTDTEASCFYHPQNRAASPCEECGRFLCRLCELPLGAKTVCPTCFASGARKNKIQDLDHKRTMYDSIALTLATLPGLLVWPALFTAPAALYIVIRYWRAPSSLVPRTRVRYYLAALFALAEMAGVGLLIWGLTQIPLRPVAR
jgi:hypothetical protein